MKIQTYLDIAESLFVYKVKKGLSDLKVAAEKDDCQEFLAKFEEYKDAISSLNLVQQIKMNTQELSKGNDNGI